MSKLGIGVIGLGRMGRVYGSFVAAQLDEAKLVAVSDAQESVLEHYTAPMLDQFISIVAAGTVISYALYTVSAETVALHGTRGLIATVPFVLYGMLRYLWRLHRHGGGGDPAQELLTDPHLLAASAGWLLLVLFLLGGVTIR